MIRSLQEHLLRWGITPLHLLSGRGHHHQAWRISRNSQAFRRFAEQGVLLDTLQGIYQHPQLPYEEAAGQDDHQAILDGARRARRYLRELSRRIDPS